ncbi:MAG: hypothetical protein IKP86_04905 [Anaerolineaceae bacterium]|nr:hypothetical protein [Anaerolineaceae bacterium]
MGIKTCPKGHHYNTDDNDSCPYCDQSNSGIKFDEWSDDIGTQAISNPVSGWDAGGMTPGNDAMGWNGPMRQNNDDWDTGATQQVTDEMRQADSWGMPPVQNNNWGTPADFGMDDGLGGATEALNDGLGGDGFEVINSDSGIDGKTELISDVLVPPTAPRVPERPVDVRNRGAVEKDNDAGATEISWAKDESYSQQPVVGWLVCIEGPDKGKDFCLHGAKSTIGRRNDSSVCLSDPKVSRNGFPALVVYDDRRTHKFYLASGDPNSRNNVELGGSMLLGQSVINPYDEIRIEDTVLVFVPFCGEEFYW